MNNPPTSDGNDEAFNLATCPWIPVRDHQGRAALVSLMELFRSAKDWADLDLRPHERISFMRLLVCVTQAALGAPEDEDGWEDFGGDFSAKTSAYLEEWKHAFDLLGKGPRFLQR